MDGRLGVVKRQQDSHRKFMYIMNEVVKYRHDERKHYIDKERREDIQRKDRSASRVRKKAIHRHVLGKCLEINRENTLTSSTGNMYGHHNGRSIDSFTSDVENYIARKDPKIKKQKDMKYVLKRYKDSGKILEEDQMTGKIREYFQTRWGVHYKSTDKEKEKEPEPQPTQIRVLDDKLPDIFSFYKSNNMQPKLKSRATERRMSRIEIRDESGKFVPLNQANAMMGRRGSILPQINTFQRKRGSMMRRPSELPQFPSQSVRRGSMLPPIT